MFKSFVMKARQVVVIVSALVIGGLALAVPNLAIAQVAGPFAQDTSVRAPCAGVYVVGDGEHAWVLCPGNQFPLYFLTCPDAKLAFWRERTILFALSFHNEQDIEGWANYYGEHLDQQPTRIVLERDPDRLESVIAQLAAEPDLRIVCRQ